LKAKELYPAVFSRHAGEYARRLEEIMARGEARGRSRAIDALHVRPGMRVLDIACGPGTLTRLLARMVSPGGEVVGVDLARGMIELARRSDVTGARFEVMDMEHLAFRDASFDAAICGHGLQFATDLAAALRETRRVLRDGARFAASIPVVAMKENVWQLVDEVVDRWLPPPPVVVDDGVTRATVRDESSLRRAVTAAGFKEASVETVDEEVVWASAEELVSRLMSWWDFAFRLEGMEPERRDGFAQEAVAAVRRTHPGAITTHGRTLVLVATA
jgi:ubiquinone/menaquinone biosynthesis C-methylase UbiE